jgi:uncharacterized protein (DUF4415 family)
MPKQNKTTQRLAQTVIVDVSAEEYEAELAKGLQPDETLQPGRHVFRRGGFLQRHAQAQAGQEMMPNKVRISINLDSDVLEYFKGRAAQPNAAPYQTQINNVLRTIMEQEQETASVINVSYIEALATNQRFINAVARRLAEQEPVYKTGAE